MAEYDKLKIYPADLRRMDSEAIQGEPQNGRQQEQGIEEGDWLDYLPPNPLRIARDAVKGVVRTAVQQGAKISRSFLKNRNKMTPREREEDFKQFGAKLEGLKEKLTPAQKQEVIQDASSTSYQQAFNKWTKALKPVAEKKEAQVLAPDEVRVTRYDQDPKSSASSIPGKTFETPKPTSGVVKQFIEKITKE
jgi:hypothetical protein